MFYFNIGLAKLAIPLVLLLLLQSGTCTNSNKQSTNVVNAQSNSMDNDAQAKITNRLPKGAWGGEHISMEVTSAGANFEYDCAQGNIDRSVELDRNGSFEIMGTYVMESGGPVTSESKPNSHPARYKGHVKDNKMTLTVTLTDSQVQVGTFTLVRGQEPKLFKCR